MQKAPQKVNEVARAEGDWSEREILLSSINDISSEKRKTGGPKMTAERMSIYRSCLFAWA
jgi:hypothetical protein